MQHDLRIFISVVVGIGCCRNENEMRSARLKPVPNTYCLAVVDDDVDGGVVGTKKQVFSYFRFTCILIIL